MRIFLIGLVVIVLASSAPVLAHCDTMDGPVVKEAQSALSAGDVTPLLKWVRTEDEPEIRSAFQKTLAVRSKGPEAQQLADQWFFETLVRIHRASEGEPFTGLAPAGTDPGPAVRAADAAMQSGSVDDAVKLIQTEAEHGLRQRFATAQEAKAHAQHNVQASRAYVAAYVDFMHYLDRLYQDATGAAHSAPSGHPH